MGQAFSSPDWEVARDSKALITRQTATVRFLEGGMYRALHGIARLSKEGEGESLVIILHFCQNTPGQVVMSISDGMGSGEQAWEESRRVIELTEQLLAAGYSPRSALKLVNTILLLAGTEAASGDY